MNILKKTVRNVLSLEDELANATPQEIEEIRRRETRMSNIDFRLSISYGGLAGVNIALSNFDKNPELIYAGLILAGVSGLAMIIRTFRYMATTREYFRGIVNKG